MMAADILQVYLMSLKRREACMQNNARFRIIWKINVTNIYSLIQNAASYFSCQTQPSLVFQVR